MTVSHYVSILAWSSTFGAFWYLVTQQRHDFATVGLIVCSFIIAMVASMVYSIGKP
jgi:uncharacterized membrane protein